MCPTPDTNQNELGKHLFQHMPDDDKLAVSAAHTLLLVIMQKNKANNWVAPLPFWPPRWRLPNNRDQSLI